MTIRNVARMFDQASTALSHRSILAKGESEGIRHRRIHSLSLIFKLKFGP